MSSDVITVYTIGFSTKNAETFFRKLEEAGVRSVIDVRLGNASHIADFTKRDDLRFLLRRVADIDNVHVPELAPTEALLDDYVRSGSTGQRSNTGSTRSSLRGGLKRLWHRSDWRTLACSAGKLHRADVIAGSWPGTCSANGAMCGLRTSCEMVRTPSATELKGSISA